jgi:hypothetical protein
MSTQMQNSLQVQPKSIAEIMPSRLQRTAISPTITPMQHDSILQRCSNGVECADCRAKRLERESLQRAAVDASSVNGVPPIVHDVLNSSGQALDAGARAFMEPRFGHDFSGVRVHTDARAAESARSVNALAYTVGRNVVFGTGQYAPGTGEGRRLLAHELTHVVQQGGMSSGGALQSKLTIGQPGDVYEREAEMLATKVVNENLVGAERTQERFSTTRLQRQSSDEVSASSRPVFICSKWLDPIGIGASVPAKHAFFRIGGSGPGNDTVELEHEEGRPGCFQGVPTTNAPEDVPASATCVPTSITEALLMSNKDTYPIGKYCTWGPNSNTYVREIARLCGVSGIRPDSPIPGFDDSPPPDGTFAPSPYSTIIFGCSEIDCSPSSSPDPRSLQVECIKEQGGCYNTRPGGIPTSEELDRYNEECRSRTGYTGSDVIPTDDECRGQVIQSSSTTSDSY